MSVNATEPGDREALKEGIQAEWAGLKDEVGDFADSATTRGAGLAVAARQQAMSYAEQRKGDAAVALSDLARSVRDAGGGMQQQPNIRAFLDQAAEGIDQLAGTIRERSLQDIWKDAEGIVRRRPAGVALATFATGLLVARFVKSSAANLPAGEGVVRRTPDLHRGQA